MLLRKGGLLDPEGAFGLEYSSFWLAPTRFHQDENLVKPEHRDLLSVAPRAPGVLQMQSWAKVVKTWPIAFEESEKLARLSHIWSTRWLDSRFDYQSEKPLFVLALRVWNLESPHVLKMKAEYSGCRSWIEMSETLALENASPALSDIEFDAQLQAAERVLGA